MKCLCILLQWNIFLCMLSCLILSTADCRHICCTLQTSGTPAGGADGNCNVVDDITVYSLIWLDRIWIISTVIRRQINCDNCWILKTSKAVTWKRNTQNVIERTGLRKVRATLLKLKSAVAVYSICFFIFMCMNSEVEVYIQILVRPCKNCF